MALFLLSLGKIQLPLQQGYCRSELCEEIIVEILNSQEEEEGPLISK